MRSEQLGYGARVTTGVDGNRMVRFKNRLLQRGSYDVIMSSGDSSPPVQASSMISSTGFDVTDEARLAKVSPTTTPSSITPEKISKPVENEIPDADVEAIEEAMPIVQKTSPVPESPPKIERNGFNMDTRKTLDEREENMCLIDCIYYTQQCCNCTIL